MYLASWLLLYILTSVFIGRISPFEQKSHGRTIFWHGCTAARVWKELDDRSRRLNVRGSIRPNILLKISPLHTLIHVSVSKFSQYVSMSIVRKARYLADSDSEESNLLNLLGYFSKCLATSIRIRWVLISGCPQANGYQGNFHTCTAYKGEAGYFSEFLINYRIP